jgi:hypothetical protein
LRLAFWGALLAVKRAGLRKPQLKPTFWRISVFIRQDIQLRDLSEPFWDAAGDLEPREWQLFLFLFLKGA